MIIYVIMFLLWTLMLYLIHRLIHIIYIPYIHDWHWDHHKVISQETHWGLHWSNIFLYNDTWKSTFDLWCTEVIPTIVFCWLTGHWWILIGYYIWAAFIQEAVEHNKNFDWYPWLTSGKWHLIHHKHSNNNFGVFTPIWDILFKSYKHE